MQAAIQAIQAENAGLRQENEALRQENEALRTRVEELEEKLRTDSSNSSKPPSSDPPWADKKKDCKGGKRKRRPGGQPGHEGKTRELLPSEQVDDFVECHPPAQCSCGGHVTCNDDDPQRLQNLELPEIKPHVTEYLLFSGVCDKCGLPHLGKLPPGAPASVLGPRAMAAAGGLSGKYHLSKRQVKEVLHDLLGIHVSLGTVSNTEARVSAALPCLVRRR